MIANLILFVSVLCLVSAAFHLDQYGANLTIHDYGTTTTCSLGFDATPAARSRFVSEGRASTVITSTSTALSTQYVISSYPFLNFTYELDLTFSPLCDKLHGADQLYIFDFSQQGWLFARTTTRSSIPGGGALFVGQMQTLDIFLDECSTIESLILQHMSPFLLIHAAFRPL